MHGANAEIRTIEVFPARPFEQRRSAQGDGGTTTSARLASLRSRRTVPRMLTWPPQPSTNAFVTLTKIVVGDAE
jgi:hypothetical protein